MTSEHFPVLEFPAMLHGANATILREVRAAGRWWARKYLQTGVFPQPRRMRQVPPGEALVVNAAANFDWGPPRWRVHLFIEVFTVLDEGVPKEERQRMEEAFESFCLSTPWGALYHAVSPSPPYSAGRMAKQLASVLGFWEVLQGPRYAFWWVDQQYTLEELMEDIYREALEAWCPKGPASVRERMALMVERMARATREECLEAVLRVMPVVVEMNTDLKRCEVLRDPVFLRERLRALPLEKFESFSSAYKYAASRLLWDWYREVRRH